MRRDLPAATAKLLATVALDRGYTLGKAHRLGPGWGNTLRSALRRGFVTMGDDGRIVITKAGLAALASRRR